MTNFVRKIIDKFLGVRNLQLISKSRLAHLDGNEKQLRLISKIQGIKCDPIIRDDITKLFLDHKSYSQIGQDLFAVYFNSNNSNVFQKWFVEFGATDGISLSNTFQLENVFSWNGILAEPGVTWHEHLLRNRRCLIDSRAVWHSTGIHLSFQESQIREFSSLSQFIDKTKTNSQEKDEYLVETISLNDLLEFHSSPTNVGYLSVDTEGSEYDIMKNLNFVKYKFGFINVEHNYGESREKIFQLLSNNGYSRVMPEFSEIGRAHV